MVVVHMNHFIWLKGLCAVPEGIQEFGVEGWGPVLVCLRVRACMCVHVWVCESSPL